VNSEILRDVDKWLEGIRRFWSQNLDALASELARGKRGRRPKEERHASPGNKPTKKEKDDR
jgi:hypothetical protein